MLIYPEIDPVALALGPVKIHWYGIMYVFAFMAAWAIAWRRAALPHSPIKRDQIDDLIFYGALGVVIGGRVGYVFFYGFDQFLREPLWLFKIWTGGMSFHGGLLGVMIAMWWYGRKTKTDAMTMIDFVAPIVPLGLGFGRLGNFIGAELYGRVSDVPWAMVFPGGGELPRHPSQLYQAGLEGLLLFCIVFSFSMRPRPKYAVSGVFALCYGMFRFVVEFFREPDQAIGFDLFGWMTRGQILSLPLIIVGIGLLWLAYARKDVKS